MSEATRGDPLQDALGDKEFLRLELRRMPIEDKLKVIALMQRRSNAIRRATGRPAREEWPWEAVGLGEDDPPPEKGSLIDRLGIYDYLRAERERA